MRQRGFALFDVLLAVVLMAIAAAGSYTLVKSFRANSSTQQFIRYATTLTQNFTPFLDGHSAPSLLNGTQLSYDFLNAVDIPSEDRISSGTTTCPASTSTTKTYCYVNSGMYLAGKLSLMGFGSVQTGDSSQPLADYFVIAVQATGSQVNQVLQSTSSLFSVYCAAGKVTLSAASKCSLLGDSAKNSTYSLFLVFPKSGDKPPVATDGTTISPP